MQLRQRRRDGATVAARVRVTERYIQVGRGLYSPAVCPACDLSLDTAINAHWLARDCLCRPGRRHGSDRRVCWRRWPPAMRKRDLRGRCRVPRSLAVRRSAIPCDFSSSVTADGRRRPHGGNHVRRAPARPAIWHTPPFAHRRALYRRFSGFPI